ncbi:apoptosis regulatory protein Siva [Entomortierella parvispora]|uniref:Apoptosis regulatory protein Siva n=1 Tax=Entomortierella parvispora TaxID=205924 RepID=A0A9P3LYK4_9FUNG|nr:apoptosis regulatory protein Siva [Entomortierella parvispora]
MNNYPFNGQLNGQFSFHSFASSSSPFQFSGQEAAVQSSGSRKRKSSYEDISPLFTKTRSGIGLEEEIVYDRTITMMAQGQSRFLAEQKQKELEEQQQLRLQQEQLRQQKYQQSQQRESQADAMRRLFMVGKRAPLQNQYPPSNNPALNGTGHTFADCAGEINGCETNKIPGMRDRYQAAITPCTFCQRPQCQFCIVQCASCQEPSCRACCFASYEKSEVEFFCQGCRG